MHNNALRTMGWNNAVHWICILRAATCRIRRTQSSLEDTRQGWLRPLGVVGRAGQANVQASAKTSSHSGRPDRSRVVSAVFVDSKPFYVVRFTPFNASNVRQSPSGHLHLKSIHLRPWAMNSTRLRRLPDQQGVYKEAVQRIIEELYQLSNQGSTKTP